MAIRIKNFAIFFLTLSFLTAACRLAPAAAPTATINPNAVYTAAAQTADARLTEIAQATPSVTSIPPTATPNPTQTAAAQTAEALQTLAAVLSLTPAFTSTPSPAPTALTADRAEFVLDVTVPDGTDFAPGASFTKTWRLKNIGATTWTTAYRLTFVSGDQMGTTTSVSLPNAVAPGEMVDISVNLVAPATPGRYRGYWKMANASGVLFETSVYVEIDVVSGGSVTLTPTPGGPTLTPSPTQTGSPVSNLIMVVDEASYAGPCPHVLTFSASFTVNQAVNLTYQLEAGSQTPGFQFNLPGPQTTAFGPGSYTLSFPLEISSTVSGWVLLHITAPVDLSSNQTFFTLTCQP